MTENTKHTPGRWPPPELPPECGYVIPHPIEIGQYIAIDIPSLADAKLIAAAPDMDTALDDAWKALMWIKNYDSEDGSLARVIKQIERVRLAAGTFDYDEMRRGIEANRPAPSVAKTGG